MTPRRPYSATVLGDAALAAGLLADACAEVLGREAQREALREAQRARLGIVRDLALDLRDRLAAPAGDEAVLLAEAARVAADLAGLAACNADLVPRGPAGEVVRRCTGAVRALGALVEEARGDEKRGGYARVDARSALWRAELAVRQLEEAGDAPAGD